jgi:hypothetical protein
MCNLENQPLHNCSNCVAGYERFIDVKEQSDNPSDNDQEPVLVREQYEFLVEMARGDLVRRIVPSDIVFHLLAKGCISDEDSEQIRNIERITSPMEACRKMFALMQRRKPDWVVMLLEALKESDERSALRAIDPELTRKGMVKQIIIFEI